MNVLILTKLTKQDHSSVIIQTSFRNIKTIISLTVGQCKFSPCRSNTRHCTQLLTRVKGDAERRGQIKFNIQVAQESWFRDCFQLTDERLRYPKKNIKNQCELLENNTKNYKKGF